MHSKAIFPVGAAMVAAFIAGCSSSSPRSNLPVYDSAQIGQVIREQRGEVVAVRDVLIRAPNAPAGSTGTGSRIGAATVAGIITRSPVAVASAVGSVLGSNVGARADDRLGEEITVMVEGGQSVIIVQERNGPPIGIGERVKVLTGSNSSIYGGPSAKVIRETNFAATN